MHKVSIKDKSIYLDGKLIKGVQSYEIKNSTNSKLAELNLKMMVEIKDLAFFEGSQLQVGTESEWTHC